MEKLYKNKYKYVCGGDIEICPDYERDVEDIEKSQNKFSEILDGRDIVDILCDLYKGIDPCLNDEQKKNVPFIVELISYNKNILLFMDRALIMNDEIVDAVAEHNGLDIVLTEAAYDTPRILKLISEDKWPEIILKSPKFLKKCLVAEPSRYKQLLVLAEDLMTNQEFVDDCLDNGVYTLIQYSEKRKHDKETNLELVKRFENAYSYILPEFQKDFDVLKIMLSGDLDRFRQLLFDVDENIEYMILNNEELRNLLIAKIIENNQDEIERWGHSVPYKIESFQKLAEQLGVHKVREHSKLSKIGNSQKSNQDFQEEKETPHLFERIIQELDELKKQNQELKGEIIELKEINKKALYAQTELIRQLNGLSNKSPQAGQFQSGDGESRK